MTLTSGFEPFKGHSVIGIVLSYKLRYYSQVIGYDWVQMINVLKLKLNHLDINWF